MKIYAQDKFNNWEEFALEAIRNEQSLKKEQLCPLENPNLDSTQANTHILSCKVITSESQWVYLSVSNFKFTLFKEEEEVDLITCYTLFGRDFQILKNFRDKKYDILRIFCEDCKVFYNDPNDCWRASVDFVKKNKSISFEERLIAAGETHQRDEFTMHVDLFNLLVKFDQPMVYFQTNNDQFERKGQMSDEEMDALIYNNYVNWYSVFLRRV